jgi:hypothetical protein
MEDFMGPSNWNHLNRGPGHRYSHEERAALLRGFEQFGGSLYARHEAEARSQLPLGFEWIGSQPDIEAQAPESGGRMGWA